MAEEEIELPELPLWQGDHVVAASDSDEDTYLAEWLIEGTDKLEAVMESFQSLDPAENYQLSGSQMILIAEALELFQRVIHDCSL